MAEEVIIYFFFILRTREHLWFSQFQRIITSCEILQKKKILPAHCFRNSQCIVFNKQNVNIYLKKTPSKITFNSCTPKRKKIHLYLHTEQSFHRSLCVRVYSCRHSSLTSWGLCIVHHDCYIQSSLLLSRSSPNVSPIPSHQPALFI